MGTPIPEKPLRANAHEVGNAMLAEFNEKDGWTLGFAMNGAPVISRPGFEITHWFDKTYQCVVISSKYRFVGIGDCAGNAFAQAVDELRKFHDELTAHLAAV